MNSQKKRKNYVKEVELFDGKRIFVFGHHGHLGSALVRRLEELDADVRTTEDRISASGEIDVKVDGMTSERSDDFLQCDVVINCAAVSDTRQCQRDWLRTRAVNATFPIFLAKMIDSLNPSCRLVHISTGCIFDGNDRARSENDAPTPKISYALQKLQGEMCATILGDTVVIRPRMLFSSVESKANMLWKVDGFDELITEHNSMTCVTDLVEFIALCCQDNKVPPGTYNFCNPGLVSPFDIKQAISNLRGFSHEYTKMSKHDLHKEIGMTLTNTWIDSSKAEKYYKAPNVLMRIRDCIAKSEWLCDRAFQPKKGYPIE